MWNTLTPEQQAKVDQFVAKWFPWETNDPEILKRRQGVARYYLESCEWDYSAAMDAFWRIEILPL